MITRDEDGNTTITIDVEPWDGISTIASGDYVGKYKHVNLHAVHKSYYRMNDDMAYGLKSNAFDTMKLPRFKSWEKAIEKYKIGKTITIDKVKFEIHKVELTLPVEAFADNGKPSNCEDYFLDVYFKLEGSEVNPTDVIVQIG